MNEQMYFMDAWIDTDLFINACILYKELFHAAYIYFSSNVVEKCKQVPAGTQRE